MMFTSRILMLFLISLLAITIAAAPVSSSSGLLQRDASHLLLTRLAALIEPRGGGHRGGNKRSPDALAGGGHRGGNKRDAAPGGGHRGGNKRSPAPEADALPGGGHRGGNKKRSPEAVAGGGHRGGNKRDAAPGGGHRGGN